MNETESIICPNCGCFVVFVRSVKDKRLLCCFKCGYKWTKPLTAYTLKWQDTKNRSKWHGYK